MQICSCVNRGARGLSNPPPPPPTPPPSTFPNKPYGFCGCKASPNLKYSLASFAQHIQSGQACSAASTFLIYHVTLG